MIEWNSVHRRAADTIRVLSADAIQKANSGHPGMPMGCADIMHVLWYRYLRHNPANPNWIGRDRFILSAGHGSMVLYSLLHLYGYGVTMDDIKAFRQWESITPGHPEHGQTPGVEVSTGPLGTGFASGVGMAMASKHRRAVTGIDRFDIQEPRIFILCGDGCMMEGVTAEAAALAGHQRLDNIICIYDSNEITIEGSTELSWSSNVLKQFDSHGWRVVVIHNANDMEQCDKGLHKACYESDGRPTLVIAHTKIGYGSPGKEGKSSSHGEPLGTEELAKTKEHFGFKPDESFVVEEPVRKLYDDHRKALAAGAEKWETKFTTWQKEHPLCVKKLDELFSKNIPDDLYAKMVDAVKGYAGKLVATRQAGGDVLQVAAEAIPALIGGAADLAPSTKTFIKNSTDFSPKDRTGRNIHFGVREFAMGMAGNGMSLYGGMLPFTSTFFVFSDFMKPALRLAAMQKIRHLFIFTHDSFYVGEDGPTHQPVEQLSMLRTTPGMTVFRPADAFETAAVYNYAVRMETPAAIILTRQNVITFNDPEGLDKKVARGAYIISDDPDFEAILMSTGGDVTVALDAAEILRKEGRKIRVVSMPSMNLFLEQDQAYRDSVLPPECRKRISLEAGSTVCWYRWVGIDGLAIGIDHFGYSAPAQVLAEKLGFTGSAVADRIRTYLA